MTQRTTMRGSIFPPHVNGAHSRALAVPGTGTPASSAPSLGEIASEVSQHRVIVVVGHEGDGLSDAVLDACTHRARIPMRNTVDSLNVATAAAIALYQLT